MKGKIILLFLFFSLSFYGQNDTISVIKHTDKDVVVNKNSKIIYRGILNSLSIEVPNSKSFTVTSDGIKKISNNLFEINPGAGSQVLIIVEILLNNNKKKTEKHIFKIKNNSRVVTSINGSTEEKPKLEKNKFKNAVLKVDALDKNLNYNLSIRSFVITLPNGKSIEVFGSKIKPEVFEIINKSALKNDVITISEIQVRCNSSYKACIRPAPIEIQIL